MKDLSVDKILIKAVTSGDETAFELLLSRYQDSIHRFAWRFLGDSEAAKDVAQETFLRFFQHLQKHPEIEYLSAFLFKIARNCCIDMRRKNRIRALKPGELPVENRTAYQVLNEKEKQMEIDTAVSQLPDNQRMVILLRHTESLSYNEIAEVMSVSKSSVESLLFRARGKLREMLT